MKVTINGYERELHPVLGCTGYRAEAISLDHSDLRELAKLSRGNLYATIQQLAGRVRRENEPESDTSPPELWQQTRLLDAADPIADGWIKHEGGECPVAPDTRVHFRTKFNLDNPHVPINEAEEGREADTLRWTWKDVVASDPHNDNIVVYKVVTSMIRLMAAERLAPGDHVRLDENGRIAKATAGAPGYMGTLPPDAVIDGDSVGIPNPSSWFNELDEKTRQGVKVAMR